MNTTNWLLLSGTVVIAGRWARGKSLDVPAVVALFVIALAMTLLSQVDEDLANAMTILVLFAVVYAYGPDILNKLYGSKQGFGARQ